MSLITKNLSTNVGGIGMGGPKVHTYTSSDTMGTIAGSGYFNAAQSQMDTGDLLYVECTNATPGTKLFRVINTAGVITMGIALAFA